MIIKLGDDVLTSTNGEYELNIGVIYNFELTINNMDAFDSCALIWNGFRVIDLNGYSTATFSHAETIDKIIGTICINTPLDGWDLVDCFTIGIYYF